MVYRGSDSGLYRGRKVVFGRVGFWSKGGRILVFAMIFKLYLQEHDLQHLIFNTADAAVRVCFSLRLGGVFH